MRRARGAWFLDLYFVAGVAVLALAIWAFHALAEDILEGDPMVRFDAAAVAWVHSHTTTSGVRFFTVVTHFGSAAAVWTIAAIGVAVLRQRRVLLTAWAAAFVGAAILERVLKQAIERTRPPADVSHVDSVSYSFPSGHAIKGLACYAMLAYVIGKLADLEGPRRVAVYAAAGALIAAIGWSRVYLGAHYPSDVLAGFMVAVAWLAICLVGVRLAARRG